SSDQCRRRGVSSGDKISTLGKLLKHDISHALSLIPQSAKTALAEGVRFMVGTQRKKPPSRENGFGGFHFWIAPLLGA
ncbi:hypothetical protein, partial [Donghicola sp.]|uniref:hypothetical protein n=1 Tax=Donghicola sp. TaxID=1929294 RepID=UPI0025E66872